MSVLLVGWLSQVDFESKQPDESNLDLGMQASFHLSYTVLQGNSGTSKTDRISPSGTLFQSLDLEKFATASKSCCQQNWSSSTVELVDDTYTTVDESWLFTTRRSTVTLLLHYFALLWICCTSSSCSCAAVDKILTDIARRAVRLR